MCNESMGLEPKNHIEKERFDGMARSPREEKQRKPMKWKGSFEIIAPAKIWVRGANQLGFRRERERGWSGNPLQNFR